MPSPPVISPRAAAPPRRSRRRGDRAAAPFPVAGAIVLRRRDDVRPGAAAVAVALLTLAALALRLAVPRGLWLDEAISVRQAHLGVAALIQDLAHTDRHPPLHHLALWATIRLLGDGDLAVRLPSIVAGTLVVPLLYAIAAELYDRRTGVVAALFGTVAPLLVWYSQEARMYAFVTFFGALAVLGCVRAVRHGGAGSWAVYLLGASGLFWSHWLAGVLVLVTQAAFVVALIRVRRRREPVRRFAIGWAATTVLLAWQLVALGMLAAAEVHATGTSGGFAGASAQGASGVSFYTVVANLSWSLWGFHPTRVTQLLSAVWPLLMLLSLLLLGRGASLRTSFLAACWLGPVVVVLALGLAQPGVFDVRYLIAGVPIAFVLLARLVTRWSSGRAGRVALGALVLATLVVGLVDQQLDPANPRRYDFREALAQVRREATPGTVLLYEPADLRYVLDVYHPGVPARPLDGPLPTRAEAPRVIVLASFLDQQRYRHVVDRQLGALAYARRPEPGQRFPGVRLWRFR